MPAVVEHVEIEERPRLGGGGPGKIPHRRGRGGGDDDDKNRDRSRAGTDRLWRAKIAMAAGMISILALFAALTIVYMMRMNGWRLDHGERVYDWQPFALPYRQLFFNTAILLFSSFTLEMSRRALRRRSEFAALGIASGKVKTDSAWLGVTVFLAFGFLGGQLLVWNMLRGSGFYHASNPARFGFYLLTVTHAIHLLGGILALSCALVGSLWWKMKITSQRLVVDITSWYWHFLGILWIYVFAFLHFMRAG